MNRLGLSISYDEMMRIDTRLAQRVMEEAVEFRVPVVRSIKPGVILRGAIDNFDHDVETLSGKDGSHDTILMLFQDTNSNDNKHKQWQLQLLQQLLNTHSSLLNPQ